MQNHSHSVVLIDDETCSRDILKNLLSDYSYISVVAEASSAEEGAEAIRKYHPDIVFLDVEMPFKNGFDLLHDLDFTVLHPVIVFVTAYEKYAIEAIRHAAFDYLLKPVDADELTKTLHRYKQNNLPQPVHEKIDLLFQTLTNHHKIPFNVRSGTLFIDPKQVIYCKAEGNYTIITLTDNHEETVTCQIGNLLERLPPESFLRIGRSTIINLQRIVKINRLKNVIVFEGNGSVIELKLSSRLIHELSRSIS